MNQQKEFHKNNQLRSTRGTKSDRPAQPARFNHKRKNNSNKLRWSLILTLGVAGVIMIAYQPVVNYVIGPSQLAEAQSNNLSADDIQDNINQISQTDVTDEVIAERFDYDNVETISTLDVDPEIKTEDVVGGVYAPSVDMMMPIMYGVSQDVLSTAAGTMKPNQAMGEGNYPLISHNSTNPEALFAPIRHIDQGDTVYITDKDTVYAYQINTKEVVQPEDIHVINDSETNDNALLTLLSCTEDGTERVLVQGEIVDTHSYQDADEDVLEVFNDL